MEEKNKEEKTINENKKKKSLVWKIFFSILSVIGVIFVLYIFAFILLLIILGLEFVFNKGEEIEGIENFDKAHYVREYSGDLDSNLSIFPDDTSCMINPEFKSYFKTSLFDTDGYIVLDTKYDEEKFNDEIERLKNIEVKIKFKDEEVTNKIKFDNENYFYDAYIANDGFGSTYEYALIDKDNNHIIYIYIAYYNSSYDIKDVYLKKNTFEYFDYNAYTLDRYSIYNHTFDGGESYIEFDDYVSLEE